MKKKMVFSYEKIDEQFRKVYARHKCVTQDHEVVHLSAKMIDKESARFDSACNTCGHGFMWHGYAIDVANPAIGAVYDIQ